MVDRTSLHPHFEMLGREWGVNTISENPCKLLNFTLLRLQKDQAYTAHSGGDEIMAVVLGGRCTVRVGALDEQIGKRPNVFGGKPHSVYIPPQTEFTFTGSGDCEIALCHAAAYTDRAAPQPFIVRPEQVESGIWGAANFSRTFHAVLVDTDQPVHRLIVGETFTPSGNWSTYPPHKHEQEIPGKEVWMEEFYYFRVNTPDGFGLLKHYTDDQADDPIDTVYTVRDNSILKIDRGYHTYVSAPGYTGYYLWFLAGNHRVQNPQVDPALGWVNKTVPMLKQLGH
jgi:5-deoxy-glucuronate isomerase